MLCNGRLCCKARFKNCFFCLDSFAVRKPADLQDLAPGTNPPFMTFNGEVKVDVNKIEEFLEEKLTPPRYEPHKRHVSEVPYTVRSLKFI